MKITVIPTGTIETYLHLHARPLVRDTGIRISVPVPCYLIEHDGKKILFDAGQIVPEREQDPMANYFVRVTYEEIAVNRLAAMNITHDDIDYVVISHAHGDHCNGLKYFPHCKVIAQKAAVEQLKRFENEFVPADGIFDVSGDGRVVCIPTPGHAPGHQSLLLTCDDGSKILLVGDVIYMPEALEYLPTEQEYAEKTDYFNSISLIRSMQNDGVQLWFGHHPYTFV